MSATVSKTDKGYKLTVDSISVNFHFAKSVVDYAKMLNFNLVWEV